MPSFTSAASLVKRIQRDILIMVNNNNSANTISLSERFAFSDRFDKLFQDGMQLVEESANYLDGDGRKAAKSLTKEEMALYGTESMRLTTRLMQLASWLLLQRATNAGEMTREQFLDEKKKVKLDSIPVSIIDERWSALPKEFIGLVTRSLALQNRITGIDDEIYSTKVVNLPTQSPVEQQINLLSTALGIGRKH